MSEERKPWAVFWRDEQRKTGIIWAESRRKAWKIAGRYGGVAEVTDEPQGGGYNIEYENPDKREHFLGRHLNDTIPIEEED